MQVNNLKRIMTHHFYLFNIKVICLDGLFLCKNIYRRIENEYL